VRIVRIVQRIRNVAGARRRPGGVIVGRSCLPVLGLSGEPFQETSLGRRSQLSKTADRGPRGERGERGVRGPQEASVASGASITPILLPPPHTSTI
jgi:hypothetical protein